MFLSAQSQFSRITDKIKTAFYDYWWIVVIVFAVFLILFVIVVSSKNRRIRKLKNKNTELREKLSEADKAPKKEDVFAALKKNVKITKERL